MNPYLAGVLLGLVLLASFLILGAGLGASSGIARIGAWAASCCAPTHIAQSAYFGAWFPDPLSYYLVFMFLGTFLGGWCSALLAGRITFGLERGPTCRPRLRIILALAGGILSGFAARLAAGCTSGQALTGTALLLPGSIVFLGATFAGGYAFAWFVRRQWK